jgi:hypothetical protein
LSELIGDPHGCDRQAMAPGLDQVDAVMPETGDFGKNG